MTLFLTTSLAVSPAAISSDFNDEVHSWSRSVAETLHLINTKSYYPMSLSQALPKALDTLLNAQDKYCHFLNPQEFKDLIKATTGQFFGIGVILEHKKPNEPYLMVIDTVPGSPAQRKGIRTGDKILNIDSLAIANKPFDEAVELLKGERSTPVTITLQRGKKQLTITLERDSIKEDHSSCYYLPDHQAVYAHISLFTQQAIADLEQALNKIRVKNPKALIIDLRENPGGILQAAVSCAGLFLEEGSLVVVTKDREQKRIERYYTTRKPLKNYDIPILFLVDNNTSSAAEILAGALHHHAQKVDRTLNNHVFLLGTQTHGKGSIQEVIPVANDCALRLTTCLYYLPNNCSIDKVGLKPDFIIEKKYPFICSLGITPPSKPQILNVEAQKQAYLESDYQLRCALHIVRLLELGQQLCPQEVSTHAKAYSWLKRNYSTHDKLNLEKL